MKSAVLFSDARKNVSHKFSYYSVGKTVHNNALFSVRAIKFLLFALCEYKTNFHVYILSKNLTV